MDTCLISSMSNTHSNRNIGIQYYQRGKCDRAVGRLVLLDYSNLGGAVMYVGGNYNNGSNAGLFKVNSNSASNTNSNIGGLKLLVRCFSYITFIP